MWFAIVGVVAFLVGFIAGFLYVWVRSAYFIKTEVRLHTQRAEAELKRQYEKESNFYLRILKQVKNYADTKRDRKVKNTLHNILAGVAPRLDKWRD